MVTRSKSLKPNHCLELFALFDETWQWFIVSLLAMNHHFCSVVLFFMRSFVCLLHFMFLPNFFVATWWLLVFGPLLKIKIEMHVVRETLTHSPLILSPGPAIAIVAGLVAVFAFIKNHWWRFCLFLVVFISLNFYLGQIVRLGRVCRHVLDKFLLFFFYILCSLWFLRAVCSLIYLVLCVCLFFF